MAFYKPRMQNGFGNSGFQEPLPPQQMNRSYGFDWGYGQRQTANQATQQNQDSSNRSLPGKIISDLNDIKPNDIPGDGQVAWFPASDYSCVFAKGWADTGDHIETQKYVLEQAKQKSGGPTVESILMDMNQKLIQMEQLLIANGFTFPSNEEANDSNKKE